MNGTETKVGIGIEGTARTPVKAQQLFYHRSDTVEGEYNNITSRALASGRFPGRSAAGNASITGGAVIEPTLGDIGKVVYAALGKADIGLGPDPFNNVFTVSPSGPKPITHAIAKGLPGATGALIELHKGCYINQLVFAVDLDDFLLATFDVVGGGEKNYDNTTANDTAIFGTAALSNTTAFAYTMGQVAIDGESTCDVRNVTVTLNNNMREKRGLCRAAGRFPSAFSAGLVEVTFDASLYFSSDAERRRLMGVASDATYPYEATLDQITANVLLDFKPDEAGSSQALSIGIPKLQYLTAQAPVEGDDWIMQSITGRALYDAATGGLSITTSNETALTDPTTAGTAIA